MVEGAQGLNSSIQVAQAMESPVKQVGRLHFIDFARGLVMMIMAWDHVARADFLDPLRKR
jgi:uncharacterized membrane protein